MVSPVGTPSIYDRNLIFVHGKGGVGKTVVSHAIARSLAQMRARILWVTFEDPLYPEGKFEEILPHLWHLNCEFVPSFDEYVGIKIGIPKLAHIFVNNKAMRYLIRVAPGIHELVLLGKVWFERKNFDQVVVDMPSTGYGLAMFQSTENFVHLFRAGPLFQDAEEMLKTFADPKRSGHLVVALPEETPLRESLELNDYLIKLFPENRASFLVNRLFPKVKTDILKGQTRPDDWPEPIAKTPEEYSAKRFCLEQFNMRLWKDASISYRELPFYPPKAEGRSALSIAERASEFFTEEMAKQGKS